MAAISRVILSSVIKDSTTNAKVRELGHSKTRSMIRGHRESITARRIWPSGEGAVLRRSPLGNITLAARSSCLLALILDKMMAVSKNYHRNQVAITYLEPNLEKNVSDNTTAR